MSRVFKQQTSRETVGINAVEEITLITHNPFRPSTYEVQGKTYTSSCLSCLNPMCMKFHPRELELHDERLNDFPADMDDSVCPTNALFWERGNRVPTVIPEYCINCGICARRCPTGAIYSNGNSAVVHTDEQNVTFQPASLDNATHQEEQIRRLLVCQHAGRYLDVTERTVGNLYTKMTGQQTNAQFPNLIVRNLFLVLGNRCIIRRRGDVYFRIDGILEDTPTVGLTEVEFSNASLESPRAVLDDIAVLSTRYGIDRRQIKPFIISLEFPNIRTEYWRVIKDINDVLGIRIHSLSLGALCILVWGFSNLPIGNVNFYADVDSPTIKEAIEASCKVQIPDLGEYAVLEPRK